MAHGQIDYEGVLFKSVVEHDFDAFTLALLNGLYPDHEFSDGFPNYGTIPLITHVIRNNYCEGLKFLLKSARVDAKAAFEMVCKTRQVALIRVLLKDACKKRRHFAEYILILLETGLSAIACEFIEMKGFVVNDQSCTVPAKYTKSPNGRAGQSSLHIAALLSSTETLQRLLSNGAKVDIVDGAGYTPLFYACLQGSYDCCFLLIQHGADPCNASGDNLKSNLYASCVLSDESADNDRIVTLLCRAGLDLNKEVWIVNNKSKRFITQETYDYVVSKIGLPVTQQTICIGVVRDHLKALSGGASVVEKVQKLPLPKSVKESFPLVRLKTDTEDDD